MPENTVVYDNLIIGGGFFGCMIAQHLPGLNIVIEKESKLLTRASVNNQARVHNGYHYPRSFSTALSSHKNYNKFISDFKPAVKTYEKSFYPIAKGSKTTQEDFYLNYFKIGCPIDYSSEKDLFNLKLIDEVFEVEEAVFDGDILRKLIEEKISSTTVQLSTEVLEIVDDGKFLSVVTLSDLYPGYVKERLQVFSANRIIVCAYANTNHILKKSNLPQIPMILENTRMPLVKVPDQYKDLSITIMDGEYFSLMPFPMKNCSSIHHVKLTPTLASFEQFRDDVIRYLPGMKGMEFLEWVFEWKVTFPQNDLDDGRPIMYKKDYSGVQGLDIVVGGKLDNIYDIFDLLDGKDNSQLNII